MHVCLCAVYRTAASISCMISACGAGPGGGTAARDAGAGCAGLCVGADGCAGVVIVPALLVPVLLVVLLLLAVVLVVELVVRAAGGGAGPRAGAGGSVGAGW